MNTPSVETRQLSSHLLRSAKMFRWELFILACFTPLVYLHFCNLWRYDHYQYFPLILLAFPYLVWSDRGEEQPPEANTLPQHGFMLLSFLILAVAIFFWSPNLAMLGAVFAAGSLLFALRSTGRISRFLPLWIVLLFLVRLPGNLDISLIFSLQAWTSRAASLLIDTLHIDHALLGNVIWAGTTSYFVEEACSGINSLFSLSALTAIALVLIRRPPLHALLLMLAAIFWACMVNTIRVAALVLFNERWQIDLLQGTPHTLFGIVLFAFAIAMLFCTDQLLMVFHESEHVVKLGSGRRLRTSRTTSPPPDIPEPPPVPASTVPRRNRLYTALCPMFGVLLVCQLYSVAAGTGRTVSRNLQPSNRTFAAEDLPQQLGTWTQTNFEIQTRDVVNYLGEHSAIWTYQREDHEVFVSVDYPFWHWHELIQCYQAQGSELVTRRVVPSDAPLPPVVIAELSNVDGQARQLTFSLFRQSGIAMQPPPDVSGFLAYSFQRLDQNLDTFYNRNEPTYQVQVLANAPAFSERLSDDEILTLHRQATQIIRDLVSTESGAQ